MDLSVGDLATSCPFGRACCGDPNCCGTPCTGSGPTLAAFLAGRNCSGMSYTQCSNGYCYYYDGPPNPATLCYDSNGALLSNQGVVYDHQGNLLFQGCICGPPGSRGANLTGCTYVAHAPCVDLGVSD
jgi:hypothetical protein